MFKFSELKQIHLEITNNCQASCPMCSRNTHGGLENPLLQLNSWTLEDFKTIMSPKVLAQVNSYYFCGNFGDPLLNNDLLAMCEYSAQTSPNVQIRIHTNGSLRSKEWWEQLARALPKQHCVIFAIDGLEDTNHLYRIGTNFNKIIENAQAFISAGGNAEWAFIRFKHNEHQVARAKQLAEVYGFKTFTMKDSSRFLMESKYPVYAKDGSTTHYLEPAGVSEIKFIDKKLIDNYRNVVKQVDIKCQAIEIKEIYIDAFKNVFPCCFIAMIPYIPLNTDAAIVPIREDILQQYKSLVADLGGIDALNATKVSVKDIINSSAYQSVWQRYWDAKGLITCARTCGVTTAYSTPKDQFVAVNSL